MSKSQNEPSTEVVYAKVPPALKNTPRWVTWGARWDDKKGRWVKPPDQRWMDERQHMGFMEARRKRRGLGFVIEPGIIAIDLDMCLDGRGEPIGWARDLIDSLPPTYIERTPSGQGLHLWYRCEELEGEDAASVFPSVKVSGVTWDPDEEEAGNLEIYTDKRYMTVTGLRVDGAERNLASITVDELKALEQRANKRTAKREAPTTTTDTYLEGVAVHADDRDLATQIEQSRRHEFWMAQADDLSGADFAIINLAIRLVGGDAERIERILNHTQYHRDKWDEARSGTTWLRYSIERAIESRAERGNDISDVSMADRYVAAYTGQVAFSNGEWWSWNGARWARDGNTPFRLAKHLSKDLYREAAQAKGEDAQKALAKGAHAYRATRKIKDVLESARVEPGLCVDGQAWDRDRWLLNVENGTIDLRTRTLRSHLASDLITKLAPVTYDATAQCPEWKRFVERALSPQLRRFVQEWFGYCLTGDVSQHYFPIMLGQGANGKSVMVDTIRSILGDYAVEAPPTLLELSKAERHPTEVASLRGARLATLSESDRGVTIKAATMKRLTGDATVTARRMYKDFEQFERTSKLMMLTNRKPQIEEDTEGVWRRLLVVRFDCVIPEEERNPNLKDELVEREGAGILNWMIQGLVRWRQRGKLLIPDAVREATKAYREEQRDILSEFVRECCEIAPGHFTPTGTLFAAFESYAESQRFLPHQCSALQNVKTFGRELADTLGDRVQSHRGTAGTRGWKGVRVK